MSQQTRTVPDPPKRRELCYDKRAMRGVHAQVRAIARSMKLDEAADKNNAQAIIAAFAPFKDSKVHETERQTGSNVCQQHTLLMWTACKRCGMRLC